jgi:hypothetical protein
MDPIAIILTIAACIAGLVALYFVFALTMFVIASKRAKKFMADDDFFKDSPFRR